VVVIVGAEVVFVVDLAGVAFLADIAVEDVDRIGEGVVPLRGGLAGLLDGLLEGLAGGILVGEGMVRL